MKQRKYKGCIGKYARPYGIGQFMACVDCSHRYGSHECGILRRFLRLRVLDVY